MKIRYLLPLAVATCVSALHAQTFIDPGFLGTTQYDGWAGLNSTNYPGYPNYGNNTDAWPSPIASNQPGSGDAEFNKTAGSGYPLTPESGGYIYVFGGMSTDAADNAGSFQISDSTVVNGLENVMLQTFFGGASYLDGEDDPMEFTNGIFPVLSYNGGSQNLVAGNYLFLGEFPTEGVDFGDGVAFLRGFQWDLRGIVDPITSYSITWNNSPHSQLYSFRVDQSDVYTTVVPEPSSLALLAIAVCGGLILYRRRIQSQ